MHSKFAKLYEFSCTGRKQRTGIIPSHNYKRMPLHLSFFSPFTHYVRFSRCLLAYLRSVFGGALLCIVCAHVRQSNIRA